MCLRSDICRKLLEANDGLRAAVDAEGASPLHLAVAHGHIDVIRTLLREGVPVRWGTALPPLPSLPSLPFARGYYCCDCCRC